MNKSHLVACVGCARHVRASETVCPFCRTDLPRTLREVASRRPPAVRLGRAALMALGTGAATIATACGGNVSDGDPQVGVTAQPSYGAAIINDAGNDGSPDANFMGGPAYGGVSPEDGGHVFDSGAPLDAVAPPDDAGDASDAQDEPDVTTPPPHDGGVLPAYGLPPSP